MARRIITGTLTYSSTANRDAALTRINTALSSYAYTNFTSTIGTGIVTSGTTSIIISIEIPEVDVGFDAANSVYSAATSTNRSTSGYLSVNTL